MQTAKKTLEKSRKSAGGVARQPKAQKISVVTEESDPTVFKHLADMPKNFQMAIYSMEQANDEALERLGDSTPFMVRQIGKNTLKEIISEGCGL